MSLKSRLADWLLSDVEVKDAGVPTGAPGMAGITADSSSSAVYTAKNARMLSQVGYLNNITVYRAVKIVAEAVASVDWKVVKKSDKKIELTDHPLAKLFQKPNPDRAKGAFIEQLVSYWMIAGVSYVFGSFPGMSTTMKSNTPPSGLWNLRPDLVEQKSDNAGVEEYIYTAAQNVKMHYPPWKIMPLRFFHPLDELSGVSPILVAATVVERQNQGEEWNMALMQHMARPSGAFVAKGNLSDPVYDRLKREVMRKYAKGVKTVGVPMLLENGVEYVQLALSPVEADWIQSDANAGRKIATAIGVDPLLLNDKQFSTYNNMKEAQIALWTLTALPIVYRLQDEWNGWLCPFYGDDIELEPDLTMVETLKANRQEDSAITIAQWNNGLQSWNEARTEIGLDEVPDGDFFRFGPNVFVDRDDIKDWIGIARERRMAPPMMGTPPVVVSPVPNQPLQLPPGKKPAPDAATGKGPARLMGGGSESKPLSPAGGGLSAGGLPAGKMALRQWYQIKRKQEKAVAHAIAASRAPLYTDYAAQLAQHFLDEKANILYAVKAANTIAVAHTAIMNILEQGKSSMAELMGEFYLKAANTGAARIQQQFGTSKSIWTRPAVKALAISATAAIDQIYTTTTGDLSDVFGDAENLDELALEIDQLYDGYADARTNLISTTQMTAADNYGSYQAAVDTGLPLTKTWVTMEDEMVRKTHAEADGQQQEIDIPFEVGSSVLQYPGDIDLGAESAEVVGCRCGANYEIDFQQFDPLVTVANDASLAELDLSQSGDVVTGGRGGGHVTFPVLPAKFNPYHDDAGRFDTGDGSGPVGIGIDKASGMGFFGAKEQAAATAAMAKIGLTDAQGIANLSHYMDLAKTMGLFDSAKGWYGTAHGVAADMAAKMGITIEQAAGLLAAQSPQSPWNKTGADGQVTTPNLNDAMTVANFNNTNPSIQITQQYADSMAKYEDKTGFSKMIGQTVAFKDMTPWQQAYAISPFVSGYPANVVKSMEILNGASPDDTIGGPKTRAFYSNIMYPDKSGPSTIDTWMVRAVMDNRSLGVDGAGRILHSTGVGGLKGIGLYPKFADLLATVAANYGVKPHEAQAIIWSAIRGKG